MLRTWTWLRGICTHMHTDKWIDFYLFEFKAKSMDLDLWHPAITVRKLQRAPWFSRQATSALLASWLHHCSISFPAGRSNDTWVRWFFTMMAKVLRAGTMALDCLVLITILSPDFFFFVEKSPLRRVTITWRCGNIWTLYFYLCLYIIAIEIRPRNLHMLDKGSTTEPSEFF